MKNFQQKTFRLLVVAYLIGCLSAGLVFAQNTTPKTLEPSMFSGNARLAYEVAQKYPTVLSQMRCYCGCETPGVDHTSLLSCFVDKHGANCMICQEEALMAAKLHEEGKPITEIRAAIDSKFGKNN
ncbi:MAG: PCYCGC domain-containing protein [Candidatus Magnetoovum sp. WYHC-5]|nr:PCYCGC domain-containing protein [Candidatus Magnetoovum sp. WYHC-5]